MSVSTDRTVSAGQQRRLGVSVLETSDPGSASPSDQFIAFMGTWRNDSRKVKSSFEAVRPALGRWSRLEGRWQLVALQVAWGSAHPIETI